MLSIEFVFEFSVWLQKVKLFLVFSDLIETKNKRAHGSVGKVFLMIKIGLGFIGSLVYSLVTLWWHYAQDR
jgi:hypothetical protein